MLWRVLAGGAPPLLAVLYGCLLVVVGSCFVVCGRDIAVWALQSGFMAPELSIIVPAWNEAGRLPVFLDSLAAFAQREARNLEAIIVDDGSTDDTARITRDFCARHPYMRVLRHARNQGKGAAILTGMRHARATARLYVDADGATGFEQLAALEAHAAPVVIGSRHLRGSQVAGGALRRLLGRALNLPVRWLAAPGVRDTQCGFKLFRGDGALELFRYCRETGYALDIELLFLAARRGVAVGEVPVAWRAVAGSKVRVLHDGGAILRAAARVRRRWSRGEYATPADLEFELAD
jgi:dolichyl-phosphate beta-glucosyltransferase